MDKEIPQRLLNPERIVYIKRILRHPAKAVTYESLQYWMALAVMFEVIHEENTASIRVLELEDYVKDQENVHCINGTWYQLGV